jgi:hypothetical protein
VIAASCSKSQKHRNSVQSLATLSTSSIPDVSSPLSPVGSSKPSLKGNIKVRLLLGNRRPLTTLLSSAFPKKASSGLSLKGKTSEKHSRWKGTTSYRKKQHTSDSDESNSSSASEESDSDLSTASSSGTKYCLASEKPVHSRVRAKVTIPLQKPQSSVAARAKQLLIKARCRDVRTDEEKKPAVWAPRWHGKFQLPEQSSRSSRKITLNKRFLDDSYSTFSQKKKAKLDVSDVPVQTTAQPEVVPIEKAPADVPVPRKMGLFEQPLICNTKRKPKPLQTLIAKWSEDYDSNSSRVRSHDNKSDKLEAGKLGSVENLRPLTATAIRCGRKASVDKAKRFLTRVGASASQAAAKEMKNSKNATAFEETSFSQVLSEPVHTSGTHATPKACKICQSTVRVQRHFQCKVPVCRACMRFYRKFCEHLEAGNTDDYACKFGGKLFMSYRLEFQI